MPKEITTWDDWIELGKTLGFCGDLKCATHDHVDTTEDEDEEWEAGGDPCQPVVRIWTFNEKDKPKC